MKRLLLLRHAKSSHGDDAKDKERPLSPRGRGDAPHMGSHMHHKGYVPQLVLCSPAKRTVETWDLLAPELDTPAEVRFPGQLYLASAATMGKLVRATDDSVSVLLVVGHNPGMEECAQTLARKPETASERKFDAELRAKFPTCALAVLDFSITSWSDITAASGTLADFARPKDLGDE